MKSLRSAWGLHPDGVKSLATRAAHGACATIRLPSRLIRLSAIAVFIAMMVASVIYTTSSAASVQRTSLDRQPENTSASISQFKNTRHLLTTLENSFLASTIVSGGNFALLPQPLLGSEVIETRDSTCTNPKTTFTLGEQVCVMVSGTAGSMRRVNLVDPLLYVVSQTDVTTDPQLIVFTLPNTPTSIISGATVDNRGTWRVSNTNVLDTSVVGSAFFTVRDPQNQAVDVSVFNAGPTTGGAGQNVAYKIEVTNNGPDTATNVSLVNPVPANATFVSASQAAGPGFTCTHPSPGGTGSSTCTLASMANGQVADFVFIYQIDAGAPQGDQITNTPTVSSSAGQVEVRNADNTFTASTTVSQPVCQLTCRDNIVMNADNNSSGAIVNYAPATTGDNALCGTVTSSPESGSVFPIGTTTVVVLGSNGSPCSFNVTINDTQAPVISCPAPTTVAESAPGSGSATVNVPPATATDNGPTINIVGVRDDDLALDAPYPVGETTIQWTATDGSGLTDTCDSTVVVTGSANNCALDCPDDITVDAAAGACDAPITFAATATDCDPIVYQADLGGGTVTVNSGDSFPVGTTIVTASASGRSCTFRVTVRDTEAPQFTCPTPISVNAAANSCEAVVSVPTPTATDNCAGATVSGVREDGEALNAPYPTGSTKITWTATDASGNPTSCEQTVNVKDTSPPSVVVNVPDNILDALLTASADASCSTEIPDLTPYVVASDSCAPTNSLTVIQTPTPGSPAGLGPHPITITVYDGDLDPTSPPPNSTTVTTVRGVETVVDQQNGTVQVIVKRTLNMVFNVNDTTAPTITAPADGAYECASEVPAADPSQATAADNCSTPTITVAESNNGGAGSPASPLVISRTFTAKDGANLTASATQTITVIDDTAPTISCPANLVVYLPLNSTATSMAVNYPAATATDNCGGSVNIANTQASGSVFPVGTTTVTSTATDAAGNQSSCSFTVTVLYNFTGFFAPVNNLPTLNVVNAGRAIPVKFSLSGNKGLSIFAANSPQSGSILCDASAPATDLTDTVTAGGSSLSYSASSDQYNYIWKTESSWAGTCRQLVVTLNDGSVHVANFKFK